MPAPLGRWPETKRPMGIGFMMPCSDRSAFGGTPRFADMREMILVAEAAGYDACWVPDHLIMRLEAEGNVTRGVWEGWTSLAALAASTSRITLGVLVTCTGFRHPGIIAKMAENLDEISGGRFVLGLGAGWHLPEYEMLRLPFDHRASRFEDAIRIIAPLLREGEATHEGTYCSAENAVNLPRGPRGEEGGPPMLVGTAGHRMMRLTARYADAWNSDWKRSADLVVPMLAELDEACADVGRDPATLVRTSSSNIAMDGCLGIRPDPITGDADHIAGVLAGFRDLGLCHHVAGLDPCTPASLEQYARVIEVLDRDDDHIDGGRSA